MKIHLQSFVSDAGLGGGFSRARAEARPRQGEDFRKLSRSVPDSAPVSLLLRRTSRGAIVPPPGNDGGRPSRVLMPALQITREGS